MEDEEDSEGADFHTDDDLEDPSDHDHDYDGDDQGGGLADKLFRHSNDTKRNFSMFLLVVAGVMLGTSMSGTNLPWTTFELEKAELSAAATLQVLEMCEEREGCVILTWKDEELLPEGQYSGTCDHGGKVILAALSIAVVSIARALFLLYNMPGSEEITLKKPLLYSLLSFVLVLFGVVFWIVGCHPQVTAIVEDLGTTEPVMRGIGWKLALSSCFLILLAIGVHMVDLHLYSTDAYSTNKSTFVSFHALGLASVMAITSLWGAEVPWSQYGKDSDEFWLIGGLLEVAFCGEGPPVCDGAWPGPPPGADILCPTELQNCARGPWPKELTQGCLSNGGTIQVLVPLAIVAATIGQFCHYRSLTTAGANDEEDEDDDEEKEKKMKKKKKKKKKKMKKNRNNSDDDDDDDDDDNEDEDEDTESEDDEAYGGDPNVNPKWRKAAMGSAAVASVLYLASLLIWVEGCHKTGVHAHPRVPTHTRTTTRVHTLPGFQELLKEYGITEDVEVDATLGPGWPLCVTCCVFCFVAVVASQAGGPAYVSPEVYESHPKTFRSCKILVLSSLLALTSVVGLDVPWSALKTGAGGVWFLEVDGDPKGKSWTETAFVHGAGEQAKLRLKVASRADGVCYDAACPGRTPTRWAVFDGDDCVAPLACTEASWSLSLRDSQVRNQPPKREREREWFCHSVATWLWRSPNSNHVATEGQNPHSLTHAPTHPLTHSPTPSSRRRSWRWAS